MRRFNGASVLSNFIIAPVLANLLGRIWTIRSVALRCCPEALAVRRIFLSSLLMAVMIGQTTVAQDDLKQQLLAKAAVLDYVSKFDSPELSKRELAETSLIALGTIALPTVRSIYEEGKLSSEAELRLTRVLQALERSGIEESLNETYVTLQGEMPLSNIFSAITTQTGNEISFEEDAPTLLKVDFRKTPFWEAIDTICEDADLDVQAYGDIGKLTMTQSTDFGGLRLLTGQYDGPFRIETVSVTATRSFENPVLDSLRVGIQVSWEPRLQPLLFKLEKSSISGECDDNTIVESLESRPQEISLTQSSVLEFELALQIPPRKATKLKRLSGTLHATVPGQPTPVRFKDLDKKLPIDRKIGDIVASVQDVRKNGDITQVDLLLKLGESKMRLDSFRNWLLLNEAYATGPSGDRLQNLGWQTYLMNEDEVGITVNFQVEGQLSEYQFVFEAPAALIDHKIDFILEEIPLP